VPDTRIERYDLKEMILMMADYNGWADEREEEREALDQLETALNAADVKRRHLPGRVRGPLVRAAVREILARSTAA
jgi:predicted RNA-binding Zn ribbon-like protein